MMSSEYIQPEALTQQISNRPGACSPGMMHFLNLSFACSYSFTRKRPDTERRPEENFNFPD
jgi:hypothetical protein